MASKFTVFIGRGPLSGAISQALEDLVSLSLVGPYIWVNADTYVDSGSFVSCATPSEDGLTRVEFMPLNQALAQSNGSGFSIGVINDVSSGNGVIDNKRIASFAADIAAVEKGRDTRRTNLMIAAVGTHSEVDLPIYNGYVNLMLAPEDSSGPDATPVSYTHNGSQSAFVLHCATGIASLFGIWKGQEDAAVLSMQPATGQTFQLVRAFYRRVDGQEVQRQLKEKIFNTDQNPLPILQHAGRKVAAQYPLNYREMNNQCADELVSEFLPLLKGHRIHGTGEDTIRKTNSEALGEYFSKYGRNLFTAPTRWFRDYSDELKNLTSLAVKSVLYGDGSRVMVGNGPVLGAEEMRNEALRSVSREGVAREYAPLWQSYENLSMTLLDAKPRVFGTSNVPRYPKAVAASETDPVFVAPTAKVVIPGPQVRFGNNLPPQLKSLLNMDSIAAYDLMEAERYEKMLSEQSDRQHRDLGRVIGEFSKWRSEHADSFASCVARRLAGINRDLGNEANSWLAKIEVLKNQRHGTLKTAATAIQVLRWLGYVVFWSLMVFVGAWLMFRGNVNPQGLPEYMWVRAFEMSATSTKSIFLGVWFVLWLVLFLVQVALETRDEMRFEHRRLTIVDELQAATDNYRTCIQGQERIRIGYHQFVSLSHQLGAVMERPFGQVRQYRMANVIPANTMPESVILAEAAPPEEVVDKVAQRFRTSMYHQGWLQQHVQEARDVATRLLEREAGGPIHTDNMFALTGRGTGTALDRMGQLMSSPEYMQLDRSEDEWGDITKQLKDIVRIEKVEMLQPMTITRDGNKHAAPTLEPLEEQRDHGQFNAEIVTDSGQVASVHQVSLPYFYRGGSELDAIGVSEVLVQLGGAARAEDVALWKDAASTRTTEIPQPPSSEERWGLSGDYSLPTQSAPVIPGEGEF